MKRLNVELPNHSYPILIETDLLKNVGNMLRTQFPGQRVALISDETVWSHHGETLMASLKAEGFQPNLFLISPGEQSKSMENFRDLCEGFAEMGLLRTDPIIAFGGGVVGDLTGFAAACYMRGTGFIQIPTTLLAQVDSSVGGKTGINLSSGKNLVGAFWQPRMVLVDPSLLNTLNRREFSAGMAEVIKYGAIASNELFERLSTIDRDRIMGHMEEIIYDCCRLKKDFVEQDEFDLGNRMLLNFGHTFGHAIETAERYETYLHGEAVGIGMVIAATIGEALGVTQRGSRDRIASLLDTYGVPTSWPKNHRELASGILLDKKNSHKQLHVILLSEIGSAMVYPLNESDLEELLSKG